MSTLRGRFEQLSDSEYERAVRELADLAVELATDTNTPVPDEVTRIAGTPLGELRRPEQPGFEVKEPAADDPVLQEEALQLEPPAGVSRLELSDDEVESSFAKLREVFDIPTPRSSGAVATAVFTEVTAAKAEPEDLDTAVRRASEGDKKAIAAIRENVMPLVLRYISARAGKPGAESERLAEEVWTRIATALPAYEGTGRPFMAFVYGIAAHSVAEDQRHATAERSGGATDQTTESARQMNDLLATLPAKHREILILRLVVGMTAEETAAAVGSTPGAVRVAQKRAITKLKRTVEEGNASKRTGSVQ
ncbi:hypothetical protein CJ179_50310 [Rhodococcus sp. ACS1]|nr:hypothetical protein CJ179_50310 [Rhodococcus sp. ACS1]